MLAKNTLVRMNDTGSEYWIDKCIDKDEQTAVPGERSYSLRDTSGIVGSTCESRFTVVTGLKPADPEVLLPNGTVVTHLRNSNGSQWAVVTEKGGFRNGSQMTGAEWAEYIRIRKETRESRQVKKKIRNL